MILRNWAARFSKSLSRHSSSARLDLEVPIKLTFEPDRHTGSLSKSANNLTITGNTKDFSKTGIAFLVSSIRLNEFYLVGEGRTLNAEISFPNGLVRMRVEGQRYEQTGVHVSVTQYLVGASIVDMSTRDRGLYEEFLSNKKEKGGLLKFEVEKS